MKKLFTLFVTLVATCSLWAENVITYTATQQLDETTDTWSGGIHTDAFDVTIISHTFEDGVGTITFSGDVTSLGEHAFTNCYYDLTSITLPNTVTSIEKSAFENCGSLTDIILSNSLTSIGQEAFYYCHSLRTITIPASVTNIAPRAFEGCSGLTSITVEGGNMVYDSRDNCNAIIETATNTLRMGCQNTVIPNSVTSIGASAFEGCFELMSIEFPASLTSIGDRAFFGCNSLRTITIPASVTSIGYGAFSGFGLTSITVESGNTVYDSRNNSNAIIETAANTLILGCRNTIIPNSVTSIGNRAFADCYNLTSITIPNSVTNIGDEAFIGCGNLLAITISNSVTAIGQKAFYYCAKLISVKIPSSVNSIGNQAFYHCDSLRSITIPASVERIGYGAFMYCSGLKSITCQGANPPLFPDDDYFSFQMVDHSIPVYVPAGSVATYQTTAAWRVFTNIIPLNVIWNVELDMDETAYFVTANAEVYADSLTIDSVRLEISANGTLWMPLTGDLVVVDGNYISVEIPFMVLHSGLYRIRAVAVAGGENYVSETYAFVVDGSVVVDDESVVEGTVEYDEATNTLTVSEAVLQSTNIAITNMMDDAIIEFVGSNTITADNAGILTSGDITLQGTYESDYTSTDTTTIISDRPICASAEGMKLTLDGVTLHLVVSGHEGDAVPGRAADHRQMSPIMRARYIAKTVLLVANAEDESVISGFDEADFINCGVIEPEGAEYDEENMELICNGEPVYNCTIVPMDTPAAIENVTVLTPSLKLLRDGQVLIAVPRDALRGDRLYDLRGQEVR